MSKKFENLITLTQIQNGAPGATGAPGVSTSTKFIYCVSESEDISSLPALPEKGQTNSDWTSSPHGVNQTYRYEFISSASSYSVGGEIEWHDYSAPALWSKWAQDGTGVEIKGLAYINIENEPIPGEKYILYTNQEFTQPITGATNGDSYLANGYLFVYNEEDGDKFSCVGKIQGPNGADGKDGKDGVNGKDGKDGAPGRDGVDGKDGKDANTVLVVTNTDKIKRFYTSSEDFTLSHEIIRFTLYNNPYAEGSQPIDFRNHYQLGYFDSNDNFYPLDELMRDDYISFGLTQETVDGEQALDKDTLFLNLQRYIDEQKPAVFMEDDIHLLFVFRYVVNNQVIASKILPIENGVTQEMAKFNVTAASINASVGSSKMKFTESGLEINNGDFKITEGDQQVFGFKTQQIGGQSVSKLTMRGTVYAENGKFTGEIHATNATFDNGTIGGFNIADGKLASLGKVPENNEEVPAIELDGENGKIIAHSIELGDFATVKNQIRLGSTGSAYLKNPDKNNGEFIKSGDILIKNDGTAKFGEISVNGSDSEIYGNTWSIGKDYANFSNVNVSGSIETAAFKTNSIQAAGGAMIFRPSYKGSLKNEAGAFIVYLENTYEGAIGNQIQVAFDGNAQGYFGNVTDVNQNKLSIEWDGNNKPSVEQDSIVLIDYGSDTYVKVAYNYPIKDEKYFAFSGEDYTQATLEDEKVYSKFSNEVGSDYLSSEDLSVDDDDGMLKSKNKLIVENESLINSIRNFFTRQSDILIGINSGRSRVGINNSILPRGLTLTSPVEELPKLYLGDLSQVGPGYSGYGLYADNVFLNGSLTTKPTEGEEGTKASYAGVNTLNEVGATVFEDDISRIVFWAGAEGIDAPNIQEAPFQVTEAGSLYAQRAKLQDTLFVGGSIEATEIYTAELHGTGGALSIYDGTKGIQFIKDDDQNPEQVIFSINTSGLVAGDKNFIGIGDKITILGDCIRTSNSNNYLSLETIEKDGGQVIPVLKHIERDNNCGFYFEKTQTAFKMGESPIQTWTAEGTKIHNSFELNKEGCSMQYKQENNGYNLYIVTS